MTFDQSGSLAAGSRHDYLPFGEELFAGTGGRTIAQGYIGDSVRQKFTSYEADAETGLNFAQARYHSSIQGRFSSADPTMLSVDIGAPQSLNRYSYVMNDPLSWIDPSGMFSEFDFQEGQGQEPRVTDADYANPDNFTEKILTVTNVWQSTGMPLTPFELLVNQPLRNITEGRLPSQNRFRFGADNGIGDASRAFTFAGFAGTAGRYYYANSANTMWRGLDSVMHPVTGYHPNGATGARALAFEKSGAFNSLGRLAGYAGVGISLYQASNAFSNGEPGGGKALLDAGMGIVSLRGGVPGAVTGAAYFGVDMTVGWENVRPVSAGSAGTVFLVDWSHVDWAQRYIFGNK
jgi:RHS repeat-associated protein